MRICVVAVCVVLIGCAEVRPVTSLPPAPWRRLQHKGLYAFHHPEGGSISAEKSCRPTDDVPLDMLVRHRLIGFDADVERSRTTLSLNGRAAERRQYSASLDGVPVILTLVVGKRDGCVCDFALVAAPEVSDARVRDFDAWVSNQRCE